MSSYTHYNVRFQSKEERKINSNDYEIIKELLFSEKYQGVSWTGMFIFELCEKSNSVLLETTPIRRGFLTDVLDYIRDKGEYTIWTICTDENGGPDYLEIYDSRLKENYFTKCLYFYDEVKILFKKVDYRIDSSLEDLFDRNFIKVKEKNYQYKKLGRYYSHNEVHEINHNREGRKNNLQNKCDLSERENYILNYCDKQIPESHHYVETNWYSDPFMWSLMAAFEKGKFKDEIESVEFKYQGRLVRLYNKGVYNECYMLDNWFNLDKTIYKGWEKEFQSKK